MKFFAYTRTKRNTALAMLLVWVFAFAAGVANACFLEVPGHHVTGLTGSSAITSPAHAAGVAHSGDTAGHDDGAAGTKESCLKVCGDGTHTLLKGYSGADHTDPGLPPLVTTLWTGSMPVFWAQRRANDEMAMPTVGPPLRVRYSRLAL